MWWPGRELNPRRQPFQGCALPPELPGHVSKPACSQATRTVRCTLILAGLWNETARRRKRVERLDYNNHSDFPQQSQLLIIFLFMLATPPPSGRPWDNVTRNPDI